MNLPNKLTLLRVILVPVIVVFMIVQIPVGNYIHINYLVAGILFLIAAITDFLDGSIARKYNIVTNFGKFLDPLADKLFIIGTLICFCAIYGIGTWFGILLMASTLIILFRELAVTSMRLVAAGNSVVVPANMYGKIKTVSQMVFCGFLFLKLMLNNVSETFDLILLILALVAMAVMVSMTLISGFIYFKAYWKYINPKE